jgi:hypothetical protein
VSGFLNLKPAAAAASKFTVTWDCTDAAALPAADWKTTDPSTVNGVSMSSHNDGGTDVVELDGSTGLVMRTTDGWRSLPYNNTYPATMLLADIQASVGGSWDQYSDRLFFQARLNGTTASPEGAGIVIAENLAPSDYEQIWYGTYNGTHQYINNGTTAYLQNAITVPSDILMEIILGQWGMIRWRMVAWPGSWPDPDTFTPLDSLTIGYELQPATTAFRNLTATKWAPGSASWGFSVWHNTATPGQFTQTVRGWRCGKISGL